MRGGRQSVPRDTHGAETTHNLGEKRVGMGSEGMDEREGKGRREGVKGV